ncbi:MAG: aldolase/citrate lyase family protein [Leifsonia sp.]
MPLRVEPDATFRAVLAATDRPLAGMWVSSGSAVAAEICAGSGLDWILVDVEHGPNTLETVLAQLQAIAGHPVTAVVRVPSADPVLIKQFLDIGAQNLVVPMVASADEAGAIVRAIRYPPNGIRGVGSALARSARWGRTSDYLARADELVSLTVQIETAEAVGNAQRIAAVDGVDAVLIGPADLAASLGHLGQQDHPEVVAAVLATIEAVTAAGKPVGVNAFVPEAADRYIAAGARFVIVGADVILLARGSEALAARFTAGDAGAAPSTY